MHPKLKKFEDGDFVYVLDRGWGYRGIMIGDDFYAISLAQGTRRLNDYLTTVVIHEFPEDPDDIKNIRTWPINEPSEVEKKVQRAIKDKRSSINITLEIKIIQ